MNAARLRGCLWGFLVGDALGVPYEFHAPAGLPPPFAIQMIPPVDFARSHRNVPPGTWSDDGAQGLCLLASLLEKGGLDPADFASRLLAWFHTGYCAVDAVVFDVGVQTRVAFDALARGVPPLAAGPAGEWDNGNGSLMRVAPLALWHRGTDAALVADAFAQSAITHGHVRAQVACALYCLWLRALVASPADQVGGCFGQAVARLRGIIADNASALDALNLHIRPDQPAVGHGSGYVIDCLASARMIFEQATLTPAGVRAALQAAVALGDDTDTTACVLGGLLGAAVGEAALPSDWLALLRGREIVAPLLARLHAHHGLPEDQTP